MKAIQIQRTGGPEVLALVDVPPRPPGPGEILIRHEAIGLNFIDVYGRTGLYPMALPAVLGREAAGVVEAIGEGVTRFRIGDRAAYASEIGAYAEMNTIAAARAVRLPDAVSSRTAAAIMLKGLTAEFLTRRIWPLRQGDSVLVHAAAGGVGTLLCQWLAHLGMRVIGTAGSEEKAALALSHGCAEVIRYRHENVAERVKDLTGGTGVAAVYDSVGKDTQEASLASLRRRGILISFGNASGPAPAVDPLRLSRGGSLFLTRPTLFDYVVTTEELDAAAEALFHVVTSGAVKVEIGQEFPLAQTADAHRALEGRATSGATLLIP
ncbi:MAG TPA: quinone oxidoreductase [Caulobacteraceae bacterium]|jgi:NADPH2:quinone reductase|nr:quinone oxidoreductase [Caulobacteraceae bacterium]